jgi:hypothetical protein
MFTDLNLWAILVSGAVYWILGGVWYAAVFSKPWQEAIGYNAMSEVAKAKFQKDFPKALAAHFISGLITAVVLANVARAMTAPSFIDGMASGSWMWLGFALTLHLNSLMFEKRPPAVFFINAGFYLIAFAMVGGIVGVWR